MSEIDKTLYADADEVAAVMSKSKSTITRQAINENWQSVTENSRGKHKKKWFLIKALPKAIREAVLNQRASTILQALPKPVETESAAIAPVCENSQTPATTAAVIPLEKLTERQRVVNDARHLVVHTVRVMQLQMRCSFGKAADTLIAKAEAGELDDELMNSMRIARESRGTKDGGNGLVSRRSLERWNQEKSSGKQLAPGIRQKEDWRGKWWLALFLSFYRKPQKPSLREAHRDFEKAWQAQGFTEKCPDYDVIYRLQKKIPAVVLAIGRSTGSELAALRPFTRRDWSGMSNEVWVGDGHTFKAKVRHPDHGQPFAPEVTFIIDAASRFIVGWAFSLSENQIAVSEALGKAMIKHGKPLIYYSDNGSGQTAKIIDCPVGGMLARLGVEHELGRPGNPQGRGIIEGLWDITTIAVAKTFPTFQGTGMDGDTLRKNTQAINRAKRQGEVPNFVPSWNHFMAQVEERIDWYNNEHRHSALGGRTPAEVYHANFDESWHCPLSADEIVTLYRPFEIRVPDRGEVRWNNNIYFHSALAELPANTKVRVAYDLNDADQVWVSDLDGRAICVAEFEANKVKGFAVSKMDAVKEKRIDGMIKRGQEQIDKANAERGHVIDGEVLKRVELTPAQTVEPLKRIVIDGGDFSQQTERLSYLETMQKFMDDGQRAVGNE